MTEITVNLNKGQKLLDRLKTVVKEYRLTESDLDIYNRYQNKEPQINNYITVNYSHQGANKMEQELVNSYQEQREKYADYFNLLNDLTTMQEALFAGNITSGVSDILNKITVQKKIRSIWSKLRQGTMKDTSSFIESDNLPDYYATQGERHRTLAVEAKYSVRRKLYTDDEIKAALLECNKILDNLEDRRDALNHSFKVTVKLSPTAVRELGL